MILPIVPLISIFTAAEKAVRFVNTILKFGAIVVSCFTFVLKGTQSISPGIIHWHVRHKRGCATSNIIRRSYIKRIHFILLIPDWRNLLTYKSPNNRKWINLPTYKSTNNRKLAKNKNCMKEANNNSFAMRNGYLQFQGLDFLNEQKLKQWLEVLLTARRHRSCNHLLNLLNY